MLRSLVTKIRSVLQIVLLAGVLAVLSREAAAAGALLQRVVLRNEIGGVPMAGVSVSAAGANPTLTDSTGHFTLKFPERSPGQPVLVVVAQAGWSVVNDIQLDRELPSDPAGRPLQILLAKDSERYDYALRFYRLHVRTVVDEQYNKRLSAASDADRERLRAELDRARAQVEALARQLADSSTQASDAELRRARQLFLDGHFDEALELLSAERLARQVKQAEQARSAAIQGYEMRAGLLALSLQFDAAAASFAEAARLAPDDYYVQSEYGRFNVALKRFDLAKVAFERALAISIAKAERYPSIYGSDVVMSLLALSDMYDDQNLLADSERTAREAVNRARTLIKPKKTFPTVLLADSLHDLGIAYRRQRRFDEAQSTLAESLQLRRELARDESDYSRYKVADTLLSIGILNRQRGQYDEAARNYKDALAIYEQLAKSNPQLSLSSVAYTLDVLGTLYKYQKRYTQAHASFARALEIYRDLAARAGPRTSLMLQLAPQMHPSSESYRADAGDVLNHMGLLALKQNHLPEARAAHEQALELFRKLASDNPYAFDGDLGETLENLASVLMSDAQTYAAADAVLDEEVALWRRLAARNPDPYRADLAAALNSLGILRTKQERYSQAHDAFSEALAIYRDLEALHPGTYRGRVAKMLSDLGEVRLYQGRSVEAREPYEEALSIYRDLVTRHGKAYQSELAIVLNNLGAMYFVQKQYAAARPNYEEALVLYRSLARNDPRQFRERVTTLSKVIAKLPTHE